MTAEVDDPVELDPIDVSSSENTTSEPIVTVATSPPARKPSRIRSGLLVWNAITSTRTSVGQNAESTGQQKEVELHRASLGGGRRR